MDAAKPANLSKLYWTLPLRKRGQPASESLPTYESYKLIDEAAALGCNEIVFSLGVADPISTDFFQLVDYATRRGVETTYAPPDPRLVSTDILQRAKKAGLRRLALHLDGSRRDLHEAKSGKLGSFEATVVAALYARSAELPVEIESTFDRDNLGDFWEMSVLLAELDINRWSVAFAFRPDDQATITPEEVETLFAKLFEATERAPFEIVTTNAKHFRRFIRQQLAREKSPSLRTAAIAPEATAGATDDLRQLDRSARFLKVDHEIEKERASLFVTTDGAVWPEMELPLTLGNVRFKALRHVLKTPLLEQLRTPDHLKGKCALCEFDDLCGGSRARAFAATRDPFEADPLCCYQPVRTREG